MAITPGPQRPEKYPYVGPRYKKYGEQLPNFYYEPSIDNYRENPEEKKRRLQDEGVVPKDPKKGPGLAQQAGTAVGVGLVGKGIEAAASHYAPSIWSGIKGAASSIGNGASNVVSGVGSTVGSNVGSGIGSSIGSSGGSVISGTGGGIGAGAASSAGSGIAAPVAQLPASTAINAGTAGTAGASGATGTLGSTIGQYAPYVMVAKAGYDIFEGFRKAGQGESRLGHKDWGNLAERGFKIPEGIFKQKVGEKNAAFTASRKESDLTGQDIAETAGPRLVLPDFDTGFTPEQQIQISQRANELGLVRERNGGLRIEAQVKGGKDKNEEFSQWMDEVNDLRRQNASSGDTNLQPINPDEVIPPQKLFIKAPNGSYQELRSYLAGSGKEGSGYGPNTYSFSITDLDNNGKPKPGAVPFGVGADQARAVSRYQELFLNGGASGDDRATDTIRQAIVSRNQARGVQTTAGNQAVGDVGNETPPVQPGPPPVVATPPLEGTSGTPPVASGPVNSGPSQLPAGTTKMGAPNGLMAGADAAPPPVAQGPQIDPGYSNQPDPRGRPVDPNDRNYQPAGLLTPAVTGVAQNQPLYDNPFAALGGVALPQNQGFNPSFGQSFTLQPNGLLGIAAPVQPAVQPLGVPNLFQQYQQQNPQQKRPLGLLGV